MDDVEILAEGELLLPLDFNTQPACKNSAQEFDPTSGEWINVRRFDRVPITIEEAERTEQANKIPFGAYFVSLAHKRLSGIVQLHERWLKKTKNQCSDYADIQKGLMDFFQYMLTEFDSRYSMYTSHPKFDSIGKTRKRSPHTKNVRK
jgi:hypothetical protein